MAASFTILIDAREKKPLFFPKNLVIATPNRRIVTAPLHVETVTLKTGDYALSGSNGCLIERKGSVDEVTQNTLTRDYSRFMRCLDRLASESLRPVLLLEGNPNALLRAPETTNRAMNRSSKKVRPIPGGAPIDILFRECLSRGIMLWVQPASTIPQRRALGEIVARYLIAGCTLPETVTEPSPTAETVQ